MKSAWKQAYSFLWTPISKKSYHFSFLMVSNDMVFVICFQFPWRIKASIHKRVVNLHFMSFILKGQNIPLSKGRLIGSCLLLNSTQKFHHVVYFGHVVYSFWKNFPKSRLFGHVVYSARESTDSVIVETLIKTNLFISIHAR